MTLRKSAVWCDSACSRIICPKLSQKESVVASSNMDKWSYFQTTQADHWIHQASELMLWLYLKVWHTHVGFEMREEIRCRKCKVRNWVISATSSVFFFHPHCQLHKSYMECNISLMTIFSFKTFINLSNHEPHEPFFVLQILSFKSKNFHHSKLNAFWLKITVPNDYLIINLPWLMFQSN